MRSYACDNAVDALVQVGNDLIAMPDFEVAPRGAMTHEIRNVTIEVKNPADCTFAGIHSNWNPKIAVAEALQLIGGFSDPEAMVAVQPAFSAFLDPSGRFWGAYGERTDMAMEYLVRRLQEDPETRQGVVAIWSNPYDVMAGNDHKDFPCTVGFNFTLRRHTEHNPYQLLMTTHMRSNDIWKGWRYDAFQFMQLGWTLANFLGAELGPYTHVVDSMHMYTNDIEKFRGMHEDDAPLIRPALYGLNTENEDTWRDVQGVARELFYDIDPAYYSDSEKWYIDTGIGKLLLPLVEARMNENKNASARLD